MPRPTRTKELAPVTIELTATSPQTAKVEADMRQQMELVVAHFGDGLPWNIELYEAEIRAELKRGYDAYIRACRRLLVVRTCAPHGEWHAALERLKIPARTATRMLYAARRIDSLPTDSAGKLLASVQESSKLLEILSLPDEQIKELTDEGEVGGIKLDEVSNLTVSELNERIRELEKERDAAVQVSGKNAERLRKKEEELAKFRRQFKDAPIDARIERLRNAVMACQTDILVKIQAFEENAKALPVDSLKTHLLALVQDEDPEIAQADHRGFMAGVIDDLIHALRLLRDHPDLDLQQVKARKH